MIIIKDVLTQVTDNKETQPVGLKTGVKRLKVRALVWAALILNYLCNKNTKSIV